MSLYYTSRNYTSLHYTSLYFTSLHFNSLHFTSYHFTPHFPQPCICPHVLYIISSKLNNKRGNSISKLLIRNCISALSFQLSIQRKRHDSPRKPLVYVFTNKATAGRYGWCVWTVAVSMWPANWIKLFGTFRYPQHTLHCMILVRGSSISRPWF